MLQYEFLHFVLQRLLLMLQQLLHLYHLFQEQLHLVHFWRHQHAVNPAKARDIARVVPDAIGVGKNADGDKHDRFHADKGGGQSKESFQLTIKEETARGSRMVKLV